MSPKSRKNDQTKPQHPTKSNTKTDWKNHGIDSDPTAASARKPVNSVEKIKSQYLLILRLWLSSMPVLMGLLLISPMIADTASATWQQIVMVSAAFINAMAISGLMFAVTILHHKAKGGAS